MGTTTRRRFLEDTLLAAAATAVAPAAATALQPQRRIGANDKVRVAIIGINGQGKSHVSSLLGLPDVEIAAICDADTATFAPVLKMIADKARPAPATYQDIRKLLEVKDIDAISSATPNHWHALVAIWAMQAGKDVYIEKPACHDPLEGVRMVEASRKYGRICQVGTQSRSSKGLHEAMAFLHSGGIGKVSVARALCYKPRGSIGKVTGPTPVPATCDYDLWLGPAPQKPVMRQRFHYDWHWFWDYGNGDLGNQGVHEMDKALWGMNEKRLPKSALGMGGRFGYVDDGETPNTELVFLDYGSYKLIFEVRGLKTADLNGAKVGNIWYGEKGMMVVPDYSSATVFDPDGNKVRQFSGGGSHHGNWIKAIKSRNRRDLNCDVAVGALSAQCCQLGNISLRLGGQVGIKEASNRFSADKEIAETLGRYGEHVAANGVPLDGTLMQVGKPLPLAPGKLAFAGDRDANAMLTREYRAGYVVPDKV